MTMGKSGLKGLSNFIGFFIEKKVELYILCSFIACLVPELSNSKFFKMGIVSHFVMLIR